MSLHAWILATRPKTLTAALSPIVVATALAWASRGQVEWWISLCALAASLFIQFGTNLVNDALDFKKGTDTEERLGPARMCQSGRLSTDRVLQVAGLFFAIAFVFGIPLVREGGWPILVIGLASILFAYAYTGGPYPLAYHGLGEIFVLVFFGWIAVGGLVFLHERQWSWGAFAAGSQVGLLATVLIQVNNLRDIEGDRRNHKKTLAVRFGLRGARRLLVASMLAAYLIGIYWWACGERAAALAPLLSLPLAIKIARDIRRHGPGRIYNAFLARAALLQLLFSIALALGLGRSRA